MEMENSALSNIVSTQTQLLQQMQQQMNLLQQNQLMTSTPAAPVTTNVNNVSPSIPEVNFDGPKPQVFNPTQYASYGNGGSQNLTPGGLFQETINEIHQFDRSRTSKEQAEAFFTDRMRGFQEQSVSAVSSVGTAAATVGSFFVPGLLPALAAGAAIGGGVSYVGNSMSNGAKVALDYQDILQREGYKAFNAFESTTDFGGVGIKLEDRQDLSKYLRDLAPEKFLEDQDMQQILTGSLDNKLLKSTTDVESFKKKFTEIVDTVKQITLTMNQSIEEATAFMGELERRGVATKDMSYISGQTKVVSSMLGIDASQGAQMILSTTDAITQGTSMDAKNIIDSTSETMYIGNLVESEAKANDSSLYDYIKNNGGAGSVSAGVEQSVRSFTKTEQGRNYLLGFFGSAFEKNGDGFTVNRDTMNELLAGNYTVDQMERMSSSNLDKMSETDKAKLAGSVTSIWNNAASSSDNYSFLDKVQQIFQEQAGAPMDPETALVQMGLAGDYEQAELFNSFMEKSQDPSISNRLSARSFKEEMDSAALADSPGIMKNMEFWWKRNVTNQFGDVGQTVSDTIGDFGQDYQKLVTGIDDRGVVGGALLNEYSDEGLKQTFEKGTEDINKMFQSASERISSKNGEMIPLSDAKDAFAIENAQTDLSDSFETNVNAFAKGDFVVAREKIEQGTYAASDLKRLQDRLDNGDFNDDMSDKSRAQYIINKADGTYDGWGNFKQAFDRVNLTATNVGESVGDFFGFGSSPEGFVQDAKQAISGSGDTLEGLEKEGKQLKKTGEKLQKELTKLFSKEDLGVDGEEYDLVENYIKMGMVDEVKNLTSNSSAIKLAEKFSDYEGSKTDLSKANDTFANMTRQTEGLARMGSQMSDFVNASGVFTEAEVRSLFGDYKDEGKDTLKDLEKGKLDAEDMYKRSQEMLDQGKAIFSNMSQNDLEKMARFAADKSSSDSITMESFFTEGTNFVNSDKLYDIVSNDVLRQMNADEKGTAVKGEGGVSADTKKTMDGHEKAMYEMLEAIQNETSAMRDIAAKMSTDSNSYYSSVSSK